MARLRNDMPVWIARLLAIDLPGVCLLILVVVFGYLKFAHDRNLERFGIAMAIGAITFVFLYWRFTQGDRWISRFLYRASRRRAAARIDAAVSPDDADSIDIHFLPRTDWSHMFSLRGDVGFLLVDLANRRLLFEGIRQRWRIPASDIESAGIETFADTKANSATVYAVVLRIRNPGGVWEAPLIPIIHDPLNSRINVYREAAAQLLLDRISPLAPAPCEESIAPQDAPDVRAKGTF